MDLSPRQLDNLHEGYKVLTTAPEKVQSGNGKASSGHSKRRRPGS